MTKKTFITIAIIAFIVGLVWLFTKNAAAHNNDNEKVTLCHCGNNHCQTIEVSENAVNQHLQNHEGDHLGECVEPTLTPVPTQTCGQQVDKDAVCEPTPTVEVSPTAGVSAAPTVTPTLTPNSTEPPHSDGLSDGKSSCPECTQNHNVDNRSGQPIEPPTAWK